MHCIHMLDRASLSAHLKFIWGHNFVLGLGADKLLSETSYIAQRSLITINFQGSRVWDFDVVDFRGGWVRWRGILKKAQQ